jgi:GAF domain-containing protein
MDEPRDDPHRTMLPAPVPADDAERLAELWRTGLLDTEPAQAFNRVTRELAGLLKTPIALISLVDQERQWFLSRHGLEATETARDISMCGHAVALRETLQVADTWVDPRFSGNPLVTGEPHVRAYLGVPLLSLRGQAIGTLCVLDRRVREFSAADRQIVERYAKAVQHLIWD